MDVILAARGPEIPPSIISRCGEVDDIMAYNDDSSYRGFSLIKITGRDTLTKKWKGYKFSLAGNQYYQQVGAAEIYIPFRSVYYRKVKLDHKNNIKQNILDAIEYAMRNRTAQNTEDEQVMLILNYRIYCDGLNRLNTKLSASLMKEKNQE